VIFFPIKSLAKLQVWWLVLGFLSTTAAPLCGQDTIFLKGDTIRVGELEWDMEKDYEAKGVLISENKELYGENVRIFLEYHPNREVSQIVFGYIQEEVFIPHGPARYYYPSSQLLGKRYFKEGMMEGMAEDYYKDGNLLMRASFVDDTLHGHYSTYHPDGTIHMLGRYDKGLYAGSLRSHFENGNLEWIEHYNELGVKTGFDSTFYETGDLESVFHFDQGIEDSTAIFYHRNGRVWAERYYEQGRLQTVLYIKDKSGKELEVGSINQGRGWLNIYNDDGILISRAKYKQGLLKKTRPVRK